MATGIRRTLRWAGFRARRDAHSFSARSLEFWLQSGLHVQWAGLPLLAWGYLQYGLSGEYRTRLGGGGPGIHKPPVRPVTTGIYRFTRNPMYARHLIASLFAAALLALHFWWFHRRVLEDETHMQRLLGPDYMAYAQRVRRWGVV